MVKLLCNRCYLPLETVEYDIGTFVEPCDCLREKIEKEFEDERDRIWEDGRTSGYDDGHYDGFEEARGECLDRIDDLQEKFEKYQDLIDDDEYMERLGT